jgi:2-polyprenyl-3-methyl-5-hydroxy-6-metoxy-1,4-benzoquinol methylase
LKKAEHFWDRIAEKYDEAEERFEPIHTKILQFTKSYLNGNDIVLDYGCATGSKAFKLASTVKEIHGIDISSKMIEIARRRLASSNVKNISFTQTILFDEKLKEESFDVILAIAILHSLENNYQVVQRIAELLKPGGLFISATPCLKEKMAFSNKLQMYFYALLSKTGIVPVTLNRFKFNDLDNLLSNKNFEIIKTERVFYQMSSYFIVARNV